jgi:hypothetical protein
MTLSPPYYSNDTSLPSLSPAVSQPVTPTLFPAEEMNTTTCQNTSEFLAYCNGPYLDCSVGSLASVQCFQCKVECCTFCGGKLASATIVNDPCIDYDSSTCDDREDSGQQEEEYVVDDDGDDDGPVKFLRFIFSTIGVIFLLISILIAIRSRMQGRDLREARRRMAERRRLQREQQENNAAGSDVVVHQAPTPEDEQARYEKIVSTFYFQTVLKDMSNITADSFMEGEDEEGEDEEGEEENDGAIGELTTAIAEFFPWRKTASKDECCICLECYASGESICVPISEECDHVFHEECIVEWLKTHSECPLCRVKLVSE